MKTKHALIALPLLLSVAIWLPGCSLPATDSNAEAPELTTDDAPWPWGGMVSVANPYAAQAAADVLRRGGHAVEAAIAAHTVLGLVEPQSSGIGGGAFMLVWNRATNTLQAYNGRERAPATISETLFAAPDGSTLPFLEAWQGGLSTGVPGSVALYKLAHDDYGKLPWADAFNAAINLADQGFEVSPRLAGFLPRIAQYGRLDEDQGAAAYFFPDGKALQAGTLRTNPAYATTLRRIATEGPTAFYTGEVAQAMVDATRRAPLPGQLTMADLRDYEAERSEAVCYSTRGNRLCTVPPPSSGLAAISMVALYDLLVAPGADEDERLRAFVDAQRLAYADRDHYVGDPQFAAVPVTDLLTPDYLSARAQDRFAPATEPSAGDPGDVLRGEPLLGRFARDLATEQSSTTHLSVIDREGNAVSLTASVEAPFGNSRFVAGFSAEQPAHRFPPRCRRSGPCEQPGPRQASAVIHVPHHRVRPNGGTATRHGLTRGQLHSRLRGQGTDRLIALGLERHGGRGQPEHCRSRCKGTR